MSIFQKKEQEFLRHDREQEFMQLNMEAQKKYANDPMKQIQYFRESGNKLDELLGLLTVTQIYLASNDKKIEIKSSGLEMLYRSLLDLASHTKDNLPDGVYSYNINNLRNISEFLIEETSK